MARRAGSADLPLHDGRVPAWLGQRMARLGAVIAEAIVHHYGRDEFLRRLAHPFWFQSFGAVMGMDWHSSGITTSVIGALKRGLAPLRGRARPPRLRRARRAFAEDAGRARRGRRAHRPRRRGARAGEPARRQGRQRGGAGRLRALPARLHRRRRRQVGRGAAGDERRHPLRPPLPLAVRGPDELRRGAARGDRRRRAGGEIVNLTDRRAAASRAGQLDLLRDLGPDRIVREVAALERRPAPPPEAPLLPHLVMPAHHDVRPKDVMLRRLHGALAAAADRGPGRLRRAAAGARASARARCGRWRWSPRWSTARPAASPIRRASRSRTAARTGIPIRCRRRSTTRRSRVLKSAVDKARLGDDERLGAIRRLDEQARRLERAADRARRSPRYVAEERRALARVRRPQRLRLGAAAGAGGAP